MPPKIQIPLLLKQTVNPFRIVNAFGNNASSADSVSQGHVVGVVETLTQAGFVALVTVYGQISNPAWGWVKGQNLFLSDNGLSAQPPVIGFVQQLGKAINETTILFAPEQPVLL